MLSIYISVYVNVLVCTREHACVGVRVFVGKHKTSVQEKFITGLYSSSACVHTVSSVDFPCRACMRFPESAWSMYENDLVIIS